jgi:hypothetical protein
MPRASVVSFNILIGANSRDGQPEPEASLESGDPASSRTVRVRVGLQGA